MSFRVDLYKRLAPLPREKRDLRRVVGFLPHGTFSDELPQVGGCYCDNDTETCRGLGHDHAWNALWAAIQRESPCAPITPGVQSADVRNEGAEPMHDVTAYVCYTHSLEGHQTRMQAGPFADVDDAKAWARTNLYGRDYSNGHSFWHVWYNGAPLASRRFCDVRHSDVRLGPGGPRAITTPTAQQCDVCVVYGHMNVMGRDLEQLREKLREGWRIVTSTALHYGIAAEPTIVWTLTKDTP